MDPGSWLGPIHGDKEARGRSTFRGKIHTLLGHIQVGGLGGQLIGEAEPEPDTGFSTDMRWKTRGVCAGESGEGPLTAVTSDFRW